MARRLGVTRQDVADAAVLVAERDGLDALTVAAVAAELGCRPPSVHHHVPGIDGLLAAVAGLGARELATALGDACRGRTGADGVRCCVEVTRAWAHAHPALFAALERPAPVPDAGVPELADARRVLLDEPRRALAEAGVPDAERDRWLAALVAVVRGTHAVERAGEPGDDDARAGAHELLLELLLDALPASR